MFDNLDKKEISRLEADLEQNKKNALSKVDYDDYPEEYDENDIIWFAERKASEAVDNLIDEVKSTFDDVLKGFVKPPEETNPFEKIRKMINDGTLGDVVETSMKVVELAEKALEMLADLFFIKGKNHSLAVRTKRNCHDLIEVHKLWHEEWRKKEQAQEGAGGVIPVSEAKLSEGLPKDQVVKLLEHFGTENVALETEKEEEEK